MPPLRLLHSADWQIGKPYGRVLDPDKRARLRQARLDVIDRLGGLCRQRGLAVLVVAGDLFDSPTPSHSDVSAVCARLGAIDLPVLVIPGNHDHGGPGSVWQSEVFAAEQRRRSPQVQVLLERQPLELEQLVVLPCPLLRRQESSDPCGWLRQLDWSTLPSDKPRLVIAHGAVQGFGAADLEGSGDADDDNPPCGNNRLGLEAPWTRQVDYIALGDWHGLKEVEPHIWYSGTPEPDRFPRAADYRSGLALEVQLQRGQPAEVTPHPTGQLGWHPLRATLRETADLERLELQLQRQLGERVGQDLLLLELEGRLSLADHQRLAQLRQRLDAQLLRLKWRGGCAQAPAASELAALCHQGEAPLVAAVARSLQGQLDGDTSATAAAPVLQRALCELHQALARSAAS